MQNETQDFWCQASVARKCQAVRDRMALLIAGVIGAIKTLDQFTET